MYVLVTCKYEEDLIKNEGARVFTTFSPFRHGVIKKVIVINCNLITFSN